MFTRADHAPPLSPFFLEVGSGRALCRASVFTRDGVLVAEATQQGMLRVPMEGREGSGQWGFGVEGSDPVTPLPPA